MEIDENSNKTFVPLSNNLLHQIHNQIHEHGAKDVIEQGIYMKDAFNKLENSMLLASSSFMDMALQSSPISDVSSVQLQPTFSNQVIVHTPAIRQVKCTARKSSLKVRKTIYTYGYSCSQHSFGQASVRLNNTSPSTPIQPTVTKHVTWKSPEVESARAIAQGEALSGTLSALTMSSPQSPFKPAGYSAEAYCFSDDITIKEKETQGPTPVLQVGKSKTTIVAFTPRQRTFTHGVHITRSNLARLLKPSSVQRGVQGIVGNSYTLLNGASSTTGEQHATPPKIGRKLGPPVYEMAHQTTFLKAIEPESIEYQGSDPPATHTTLYPSNPSRRLAEVIVSSEHTENHTIELPATGLGTPVVLPAAECHTEIALLQGELSLDKAFSEGKSNNQEMAWEEELFGPNEFIDTGTSNVSVIPEFDTVMDQGALVDVPESHDVSSVVVTLYADLFNTSQRMENTPAFLREIPVRAPTHQAALPQPPIVVHDKPTPPLDTPVFHQANDPEVATATTTSTDEGERIYMISKNEGKEQGQSVNRSYPVRRLPPNEATVEPGAPNEGLKPSIQSQVGKRSRPRPGNGKEIVGKRKREEEAAAAVQPVLKTPRKETPDKRQMPILFDAISSTKSSDQLPQPWAPGAFIQRNRRLSLDSSNTEPPRDARRIRPLRLPMVIEWKNQLDQISYLRQQGKVGRADADRLEEVLLVVRANMDHPFLTAEWIKTAKLVRRLKEFRHRGSGVFSVTSKKVAREIFDFWRNEPKFGEACM